MNVYKVGTSSGNEFTVAAKSIFGAQWAIDNKRRTLGLQRGERVISVQLVETLDAYREL